MKFEIIKGSKKDFEGAPDEALFVLQCFSTIDYSVDMKATIDGQSLTPGDSQYIIAERRPITEPAWSGEGLPPVGSTFDMRLKSNGLWIETKLIAAGQEQIIYFREGMEFSGHKNNYEFRPIRSPEDVAKDEVVKSILSSLINMPWDDEEMAIQIYDAIAAGKIRGVLLDSKAVNIKVNITTDEMWREFEKNSDMEDVYKLLSERSSRRGSF